MEHRLNGFGLEVVGKCNAKCEFCSWGVDRDIKHKNVFTGEEMTRSTGKISLELVDKIFEVHKPGAIIFTGLSEPFLAPDRVFYVADKIEEAGGAFAFYTNGSSMKEEHMRKLLGYKSLGSLHMSLNGTTEETRQKVMGLPLARSEENLRTFLKLRRELGREDDVPVGCVMMLTNNNRAEQGEFQRRWKQEFSQYRNCNDPGAFFTTNWNGEAPAPWLRTSGSLYCNQWDSMSPTISVDGQLYLCCYSTRLTFGHCLDPEAVERWVNRKAIFGVSRENGTKPPPAELCGDCNSWRLNTWAR
jgi:hypothetical protein